MSRKKATITVGKRDLDDMFVALRHLEYLCKCPAPSEFGHQPKCGRRKVEKAYQRLDGMACRILAALEDAKS